MGMPNDIVYLQPLAEGPFSRLAKQAFIYVTRRSTVQTAERPSCSSSPDGHPEPPPNSRSAVLPNCSSAKSLNGQYSVAESVSHQEILLGIDQLSVSVFKNIEEPSYQEITKKILRETLYILQSEGFMACY